MSSPWRSRCRSFPFGRAGPHKRVRPGRELPEAAPLAAGGDLYRPRPVVDLVRAVRRAGGLERQVTPRRRFWHVAGAGTAFRAGRIVPPVALLALPMVPVSQAATMPVLLGVFMLLGALANGLTIAVIGPLMEIPPDDRRLAYSSYFDALTVPAFVWPFAGGFAVAALDTWIVFLIALAAALGQTLLLAPSKLGRTGSLELEVGQPDRVSIAIVPRSPVRSSCDATVTRCLSDRPQDRKRLKQSVGKDTQLPGHHCQPYQLHDRPGGPVQPAPHAAGSAQVRACWMKAATKMKAVSSALPSVQLV